MLTPATEIICFSLLADMLLADCLLPGKAAAVFEALAVSLPPSLLAGLLPLRGTLSFVAALLGVADFLLDPAGDRERGALVTLLAGDLERAPLCAIVFRFFFAQKHESKKNCFRNHSICAFKSLCPSFCFLQVEPSLFFIHVLSRYQGKGESESTTTSPFRHKFDSTCVDHHESTLAFLQGADSA